MESSGSGGGGIGGDSGIRENVQKAIEDLRAAGEKATGDVRSNIDSAVARLRDASEEATSKASDQVSSLRSTLDGATEDMRRELAKVAVRAQTTSESLDEIEAEIRDRRRGLGGGTPIG